jgi:hypothetical protein
LRRFDFTGAGEVFSIPQSASLDFAALGSSTYIDGTSPDQTQWDPTSRSLTPTFRYLDVTVGMDSLSSSVVSIQDAIIKEAGIGLAKDHDGSAAALYTEASASTPDHEIGTDGTELSFTTLRSGYELLLTQNAPRPYVWIIYPAQVTELLKDNTFIDASVKGSPVLTRGIQPGGYLTSMLDIDIYASDQIKESSGRHSMMFCARAAFAYGYKRLTNPSTGATSELMVDIDWNSARRMYEINMTYQGAFGGAVKTSTTNNYVVDIIS